MFSESRMAGRRWRSRRVVARRERAVARISRRMALEKQEEQGGAQEEEQEERTEGEKEPEDWHGAGLLDRGGRSGTDTAKLLLNNNVA
jgi:hypothetical protein